MPEPTISLRELRARPAIWYPAGAPLTERELLALVEAVEAAQAYLNADDKDPELGNLFMAWLKAQARFTEEGT